jgi:uncharacterized membrane protein YdjX (TVP38/TMEM64 family)
MKVRPSRSPRASSTRKRRFQWSLKKILEHRYAWRVGLGIVVVAAALLVVSHYVDADAVHAYAERLNPFVAFGLLTALPLVGFPVNVLHVAAGIRFGFVEGMGLVALSILLQLLFSFTVVHLWPDLFARRLAKVRARIPPAAHGTVCIFTLLIPGIPFFVQNYTLPMIGVPLKTYISRCLPLHTLRAVLTVGLGHQSGHFSPLALTALIAYWVLVLVASWWAYQKLRRQLEDRSPAAGGRTQSA